jgi:hypothetical protein
MAHRHAFRLAYIWQNGINMGRGNQAHESKGNDMAKLLKAYIENPTDKAAIALARYNDKHPFAACLITGVDSAVLRAALEHASRL